MIFRETPLAGAWALEPERIEDERGFFARTYCRRDFEARGLDPAIAQCSVSFNHRRGTLRGLHFQAAPHEEVKLVRATRGAVWDVIVDLRPESPTFRKHFSLLLSAENRLELYIPKGVAHGFQTLEDGTEVFYQISEFYAPESSRGYRWDDPAFAIPWPETVTVISQKDLSLPFFSPSPGEGGREGTGEGAGG
jgi:dTDP-4-dehydrorhamnose 3,5-epimerase